MSSPSTHLDSTHLDGSPLDGDRKDSATDGTDSGSTYLAAFRAAVLRRPDAALMTFLEDGTGDGVTWSHADLDREARRVAAQLAGTVAAGSPVLLMAAPGLDYLAGFFGCMYAGVIAVPAYPPSPFHARDNMDRLRSVAQSAGVTVGLTTAALLPTVQDFEVSDEPLRWIVVSRDGPEPDLAAPLAATSPDDVAFLQYTSGSTGDPKGVIVTQGNLLANALMINAHYDHRPGGVMVSWLPPYHDMGLIGTLLTAPIVGLHAVFMPPAVFLRRPVRWLQVISRFRAQVTAGPNFAYEACVEKVKEADLVGVDLSSLQIAINGAEPVRATTIERFLERFGPYGLAASAMRPSYGLAETTLLAAAASPAGPRVIEVDSVALTEGHLRLWAGSVDPQRLVSSGAPPIGSTIRIVSPGTDDVLADGEVGEIVVTGPHVTRGYWHRPETTAERFFGSSVRTGDLGAMFDGELIVTGRLKDVLILRGKNYYPHDIELTVENSDATFRRGCGVAFTVEDGDREQLVIVQEVNPSLVKDPAAVIETIRRAVTTEHAINPFAVVLTRPGSVPKTSSGKVRRSDAKRLFLDGALDAVGSWRAGQPSPTG